MRRIAAIIGVLMLAGMGEAGAKEPLPLPGKVSDWQGFRRHDFEVAGNKVIVVEPAAGKALKGRPWVWRAEFFGAFPNADVALLEDGWHVVYVATPDLFGAPRAMGIWEQAYNDLVSLYGMHPKPAILGMSRGGLYAFSWASDHPTLTLLVYMDNAVCDVKSWPGGKPVGKGTGVGSPVDWKKLKDVYGFKTDDQAFAARISPLDKLERPAKAKIPVLLVYGDADKVVPHAENSERLYERYKALGGPVERIVKPGGDHHPHGLKDPKPIVEFFTRILEQNG